MPTETSSLDETLYRHFFDPETDARDRAETDLDQWFAEASNNGASRYEIMRQLVCGIVNAQNRRDTIIASADEENHVHRASSSSVSTTQVILSIAFVLIVLVWVYRPFG